MKHTKSLKGSFLFRKVIKRGKFENGKHITLYTYPLVKKEGSDNNYLGVCVSKKHGNSVSRNRIKRWAKESYKELESDLKCGYYIVVLYKKNIQVEELNYYIILKELKELFEKQGMMIND